MKRSEAEEKIKALGAQAKSSVVKDLSFLVTNDPGSGSSKNQKAHELGIPIINEEQFLELLKNPAQARILTSKTATLQKGHERTGSGQLQQGDIFEN